MKRYLVMIVGFWLLLTEATYAQSYIENDSTYTFFLKDGTTITGLVNIIEERKSYGIKSGKKWKVVHDDDIIDFFYPGTAPERPPLVKRPNHHDHKYLIMPSSYGLKKGDVYYQNDFLLLHKLSFGLSDYVTMGVGVLPILIFDVDASLIITLTPKFNYPYKNGKGAFAVYGGFASNKINYPNDDPPIYSIHVSNTFGTIDKQITVGAGYLDFDDAENYHFSLIANGLIRAGKRWSFMTENHFFMSNKFNLNNCIGLRYMPNRFSITLGMLTLFYGSTSGSVPWLSMGFNLSPRHNPNEK